MPARGVPELGPQTVGRRVVVRRRLPDGAAGDLLGDLLRWDEQAGVAVVGTRRGPVEVALADVLAGRPVPPPPAPRAPAHRRIAVAELADVAADGWRPRDRCWLGVPGRGWLLRAADGVTARANSALVLGDPGLPTAHAVDEVERWYAARGLPARLCVTSPSTDPGVDGELDRRGYRTDSPTLVLTAAARDAVADSASGGARQGGSGQRGSGQGGSGPGAVRLTEQPDAGWLAHHATTRRGDPAAVLAALLMSAPAQAFASVRDGDRVVAIGRAASSRGWTGLTSMHVVPELRGRGLGTALVRALAGWAGERGDHSLYLQVLEGSAAVGLYRRCGFTAHHGYRYRSSWR